MSDSNAPVRATRGRPSRAAKAAKPAVKTPAKKTPAKRGRKKAEEIEVLISDEENGHEEKTVESTEDVQMEETNAEKASEDNLLASGDEAEGDKTNEEELLILNDSNVEDPIQDESNVEENGVNDEFTKVQGQPAIEVDETNNGAETDEEEINNAKDTNEKTVVIADDEESSEIISDKEESTEVVADEEESTEVIGDEEEISEVIPDEEESTELIDNEGKGTGIASDNAEHTEKQNLESTDVLKSSENGVVEMEVDEVVEEPVVAENTKTAPENVDPEAENISDDELPGVKVAKVPEAEEVSDEELPGPKRAELPADTEDVSGDELPATKKDDEKESPKKGNKKRKASHGDASSSPSETPAKKAALDKDEKDAKAESSKPKKLPELDKYWKAVNDDPSDFTGWTYLLQYVDQENDMEAAREAYDAFLSHYPYCYGYWRKYADYEKRKGNKKKCEEVFERGLKAIPLSVDLWLHYLTYVKQTRADEEDFVRSQYERAVNACGLEFRSDRLWDGFIKWETEGKRLQKVTVLYDRLLATPTQGYTQHFDNFQEHVSSNLPNKILDTDEFLALRKEVRQILKAEAKDGEEAPAAEDVDAPPGDEDTSVLSASSDEETKGIKEKIVSIRRKVHKANAQAVTSRWNFEEGIKRPYFHVKPLERCQLKNWQDYLDFEIEQGDKTRVIVLFERCLIACALYEDFWLKFVRFLENLKDPEMLPKVRDVYERACTIHHLKKPNLHMQWAIFEEASGNQNRAAEILVNLEKQVPNVLQVAYRRINLERRRGDFEKCQQLFEHYIGNSKNKMISSNIAIKYSRFSLKILKDAAKAQEVLKTAITKDPNNPRLYLQLIDLILQKETATEEEICAIIDEFLEKETVEPEQKTLFAQRKLEFLEDFGKTVQSVQAAQEQYKNFQKLSKEGKKKDVKRQPLGPLPDNNPETTPTPLLNLYEEDDLFLEDDIFLEDDLFLESLGIQHEKQKLTSDENHENQKDIPLERPEKPNKLLGEHLETILSEKQKRKLARRQAKELKRLKEKKNKVIKNQLEPQFCEIVPEIIEIKQEPLVEGIDIYVPDLEIHSGTSAFLPDVKVEQLVDDIDEIVLDVKVEELVSLKEEIVEMENKNQEDTQIDFSMDSTYASDNVFRKTRKKGREKQGSTVENEGQKENTKLEKMKHKEKTKHREEKEEWKDYSKQIKVGKDDQAVEPILLSSGNPLLKRIGAFQQFLNESKERRADVKKHVELQIPKSSGEVSSLDSSVEIIESGNKKHKKHKKKSKKRKRRSISNNSDSSVIICDDPIPNPQKSHRKSRKKKNRGHSADSSKHFDEFSDVSSKSDEIISLEFPESENSHHRHHLIKDKTRKYSVDHEIGMDDREILRKYYNRLHSHSPEGFDSRHPIYSKEQETRRYRYSMEYEKGPLHSGSRLGSRHHQYFKEEETRRLRYIEDNTPRRRSSREDERNRLQSNSRNRLRRPRSSKESDREKIPSSSRDRMNLGPRRISTEADTSQHRSSTRAARDRQSSSSNLNSSSRDRLRSRNPIYFKSKQRCDNSKDQSKPTKPLDIEETHKHGEAEKLKKFTDKDKQEVKSQKPAQFPKKKVIKKQNKKGSLNTNKKETLAKSSDMTETPKKKPKRNPKKKKKKQAATTTTEGGEIKQESLNIAIKKKKKKRSGADQKRRWRRKRMIKVRIRKEELKKSQEEDKNEKSECCDDVASLKMEN